MHIQRLRNVGIIFNATCIAAIGHSRTILVGLSEVQECHGLCLARLHHHFSRISLRETHIFTVYKLNGKYLADCPRCVHEIHLYSLLSICCHGYRFLPHWRICSEPLNKLMGVDHAISIPIGLLKPISSTPLRNTKHPRQKSRHFFFRHDTISCQAMDLSDLFIPPQCEKKMLRTSQAGNHPYYHTALSPTRSTAKAIHRGAQGS